jgi:hypothetical protein
MASDQWEVCLVNREITHTYSDASCDVRYEAKAISPSGTAVIITSATVEHAINNFGVMTGMGPMLANAYSSVIERLLADGWEPLAREFFRRRVQP